MSIRDLRPLRIYGLCKLPVEAETVVVFQTRAGCSMLTRKAAGGGAAMVAGNLALGLKSNLRYFVAALSVACLYSIITGVLSVLVLVKPGGNSTTLQFYFVILDALLLGIVAAATGAAGGIGYIGFKGNSHTQWQTVCNNFGSFCSRFAASIFLSLISSITLLLLVWLSGYVLSKKITRP